MDSTIVRIAKVAANTAQFLSFECHPTLEIGSTTVAPKEHKPVVLCTIGFSEHRTAQFAKALRAFCASIDEQNDTLRKDVFVLYGSYVGKTSYVVALSRTRHLAHLTALPSETSMQSDVPPKGKQKLEMHELPTALANVETWLKSAAAQDTLTHSDEVYEDFELTVDDAANNELILFTHSDEHNVTMRYIVELGNTLDVIGITEAQDFDCKACLAEHAEHVALGRNGW